MQDLYLIKKSFKYFTANKVLIVSGLYVCAIVKDFIWYSMFGINIFGFMTIQDTFMSFLDSSMIFILLLLNYILIWLLFSKSKKNVVLLLLKAIIFLATSFIYFLISKKVISFIPVLFILAVLIYLMLAKSYNKLILILSVFLIGYSTIEPLTQGYLLKKQHNKSANNSKYFLWSETNRDFYTFKYKDSLIDTKLDKYFLVGNTREYFFIFNKLEEKSNIIPKSECTEITAEFKIWMR